MRHIEEYLSEELLEVLDRIVEVANVEKLKQSVDIAFELRESILASCNSLDEEMSTKSSNFTVQSKHVHLAHQLQSALMALQVLTVEQAPALASSISNQMLQRVAEVTSQLFEDLAAVVSAMQVTVQQADIENKTEQKQPVNTGMSTEQIEKSMMVFEEAAIVQKEKATLAEQPDEPVVFLATEAANAEVELRVIENMNEIVPKLFEQATSIESTDTITQLLGKTKVEENIEIDAVESAVIDSDETESAEQQAVNKSSSKLIVDKKVDEVVVVPNTEVISVNDFEVTEHLVANESMTEHEDEVKIKATIDKEAVELAPLTGNFVLNYCITLIY